VTGDIAEECGRREGDDDDLLDPGVGGERLSRFSHGQPGGGGGDLLDPGAVAGGERLSRSAHFQPGFGEDGLWQENLVLRRELEEKQRSLAELTALYESREVQALAARPEVVSTLAPLAKTKSLSHRRLLAIASDSHGDKRHNVGGEVAAALNALSTVTTLNLARQCAATDNLRRLGRQLLWLPALTGLDLSNNALDDSACEEIAVLLQHNLLSLDLSCNNLGEAAASVIAQQLVKDNHLQIINLCDNPFSCLPQIGTLFSTALHNNNTLWSFSISLADYPKHGGALGRQPKDPMNGTQFASVLEKQLAAKKNKPIQHRFYNTEVSWRNTPMQSVSDKKIVGLHALKMAYSHLSRRCARTLADNFGALTALDMSFSYVAVAGAQELAKGLLDARLTSLDLRHNGVGSTGASSLFRALRGNRHLTALHMNSNQLCDRVIGPMVSMLSHNAILTSVDISHNNISSVALESLAFMFQRQKNMTCLTLGDLSTLGSPAQQLHEFKAFCVRNRDQVEDNLVSRTRQGQQIIYHSSEMVEEMLNGQGPGFRGHGLLMQTVTPLYGMGALRSEWVIGGCAFFRWTVTRTAPEGDEEVVAHGGQDCGLVHPTQQHRASFDITTGGWTIGDMMQLYIRPTTVENTKISLWKFVVAVQQTDDHCVQYFNSDETALSLGGPAHVSGPEETDGFHRLHEIYITTDGDLQLSWLLKAATAKTSKLLPFSWVITRRFFGQNEEVVAEGDESDAECDTHDGFRKFVLASPGWGACDTLCLWACTKNVEASNVIVRCTDVKVCLEKVRFS
jgi:Ran GTPase-activating protein (RanGAP) involved in mRNA processing and transport